MPRLAHLIARNRKRRALRALAWRAQGYLNSYENLNYDPETNGERYILETLSRTGLCTVFDVGANEGNWAAMAKMAAPAAEVHCFEVLPATALKLQRRLETVAGVIVNPFGLSDRAGEVQLKTFADHSTWTTVADFPRPEKSEIVAGRVVSGDVYVAERHVSRIDFLKIDVEGAEHLVLDGFEESFRAGIIHVVQFEYGTVNILTHFLLKDFYDFFSNHGFAVGKLYPNHVEFRPYNFSDEDFRGPNYVAARKSRTDLLEVLS